MAPGSQVTNQIGHSRPAHRHARHDDRPLRRDRLQQMRAVTEYSRLMISNQSAPPATGGVAQMREMDGTQPDRARQVRRRLRPGFGRGTQRPAERLMPGWGHVEGGQAKCSVLGAAACRALPCRDASSPPDEAMSGRGCNPLAAGPYSAPSDNMCASFGGAVRMSASSAVSKEWPCRL